MTNARVPFTFFFAFVLSLNFTSAQKIKLINSGEVIKQAIVRYDSGQYAEAIALFKTVPKRDTNYVYMLSELALAYNANKNYKEAIEVCEEGLKFPSEYRAHLIRSLGNAWDKEENLEKSVQAFESGIKDFPYDYSLQYNLGVAYYNHKNYAQAEKHFFNALQINPYHTGSHLNLGRMSAYQGKKVRAMMAMGVYLSISNTDNDRLIFIEHLLNNELKDEGTLPFAGKNSFEKLDQIIRAKVVMDKNFKQRVPINAMMVRQYQLLLEQLSLAEKNPDDPWIKFYMPIYERIQKDDMLEPFLYHLLASINNDDVKRWNKKNEKRLSQFYALANEELQAHRKEKILPAESGFNNPVSFWYNKDSQVESIGNKNKEGKAVGKWRYYSTNGVKIAEGSWDGKENKINTWYYYHHNGSQKSIENYATGEMSTFNIYGEPVSHYFFKNDQIHGEAEIFYTCGQVKERITYNMGKRSGPVKTFYLNGQAETVYNYKDNKLDGDYTVYFEDGKLMKKFSYKDDVLEGNYEEYHGNGTLSLRGNYKAGNATGRWEYYHINGKEERSGDYTNDKASGDWVYHDTHGKLLEKRMYNANGKRHGEDIIYHDGSLYYISYYDQGMLVGITYYDRKGKEIAKNGSPSGTFKIKGYFPSGRLQLEGGYKKGLADGEWKHYHHEGQLDRQYVCVNDSIDGDFVSYYKSGDVKLKRTYKHGVLHGYSTEFYIHGATKEEGWFQDGIREQQWLTYYADGTLETDAFYLRNELTGEYYDYSIEGKMYSVFTYQDGKLTKFEFMDDEGNVRLGKKLNGEKEEVIQKYTNGMSHTRFEFTCGTYSGDIMRWLPDGKLYHKNSILNGKRHGSHQFYNINGQVDSEGVYIYGDENGKWTWYNDNGKIYIDGFYLDGQRDSVWIYFSQDGIQTSRIRYKNGERHGVTQMFNPEGILVLEKLYDNGNILAYRAQMEDGEFCDWKSFTGNETITAFFPSGGLAYEETFKDGLLEGPNKMYFQNGQLYYEFSYSKGNDEGTFVTYHPNGKIKEKGFHKWDELDGLDEYYNLDGSLHRSEQYKLGVKYGKVKLYSGSKASEVNFWAGIIVE